MRTDPAESGILRRPSPAAERRGDTVARAYSELRERIMEGMYLPGQRLSHKQLIGEIGVGRTPLREALRLLEANGFVIATANQGVTVHPLALGATEELYAIRLLVEPPVLAGIVDLFTEDDFSEMERRLDQMAAGTDRHRDFQDAHFSFHRVALNRYPAETQRLVVQLYERVLWHQRVYMSRPRIPEDFLALDRELVGALRARDATAVRFLEAYHIIDSAVGLVLDIEPDHAFGPLLRAVAASGFALETDSDGRIPRRPAGLRCPDSDSRVRSTSNLRVLTE